VPQIYSFQLLTGCTLKHQKAARIQVGDEYQASFEGKFEVVGTPGRDVKCPNYCARRANDRARPKRVLSEVIVVS
jgi:hypothetical protein